MSQELSSQKVIGAAENQGNRPKKPNPTIESAGDESSITLGSPNMTPQPPNESSEMREQQIVGDSEHVIIHTAVFPVREPIDMQMARERNESRQVDTNMERKREKERHAVEERERQQTIEKEKLEILNADIAQCEAKIREVELQNQKLKLENEKNGQETSRAFQFLEEQRRVLNDSRAFLSKESTLDAQVLMQSFEDLNSSIGDFAYEILRSLHEEAEQKILKPQHYNAILTSLQDLNMEVLLNGISSMKDLTPMDVVDPLVRYILCAELWAVIFHPFAPGLSSVHSDRLLGIYNRIRVGEPQERCAHWRSIAYTHSTISWDEQQQLTNSVHIFMGKVSKLLTALADGEQPKPPAEFSQLALKIFQSAARIQRKAKVEYVSFDYEVVHQLPNAKFDLTSMEASQARAGGGLAQTIWGTIGFGMTATRNVLTKDRKIVVETNCAVKALVIADNWDPEV